MPQAYFLQSQSLQLSHKSQVLTPRSKIRTVPDNQEVYLDNDGFTSIIVDILERIETEGDSPLERDGKAMTAHLEDIAGEDAENVRVWNTTETRFTHLEYISPAFPV